MQPTKKLIRSLRKLADLLEGEASSNPSFAEKLAAVFAEPARAPTKTEKRVTAAGNLSIEIPDVFQSLEQRGEAEFRFWLRDLDTQTLKAIVKENGFDPAKTSARWTERDKFIALVAEQTIARMKRGSAFLTPNTPQQSAE